MIVRCSSGRFGGRCCAWRTRTALDGDADVTLPRVACRVWRFARAAVIAVLWITRVALVPRRVLMPGSSWFSCLMGHAGSGRLIVEQQLTLFLPYSRCIQPSLFAYCNMDRCSSWDLVLVEHWISHIVLCRHCYRTTFCHADLYLPHCR